MNENEISYKIRGAIYLVEDKVIIELKSIDIIKDIHKKQLLTYLKITGLHLGILVNFNIENINLGIIRIVNNL